MFSSVDFPDPTGPSTSIIPTSPTHGVTKNGVRPAVAVNISAGDCGGK